MSALVPVGVQIAQALFDATYPAGRMRNYSETQWESRTFRGARHNFTIRFDGPNACDAVAALTRRIDAADLRIPGHLVADLSIAASRAEYTPECFAEVDVMALTLEDEFSKAWEA